MGKGIYQVLSEAWGRVGERVLADEGELRRRLLRRERVFERVPRPFCLAIRAGDRRLTEMNAWMSPHGAMERGGEVEHDVLIRSGLMKELCRPVEVSHGEVITDVAEGLGCSYERARAMERRGVVRMRGISLLRGRRGRPVALTDGGAMLDACAKGKSAPHGVLMPVWRGMVDRLPWDVEQLVRRRPVFSEMRGERGFARWVWVCPGCGREVRTIYWPMGVGDWATCKGIVLPEGWFDSPHQPGCFACGRCHKVQNVSLTPGRVGTAWGMLVRHLSGGLLYGREVKRPGELVAVRKHREFRAKRASPRRDELERYLGETDLSLGEIARRMGWKYETTRRMAWGVYRLRGVEGRERLRPAERRGGGRVAA